VTIEDPAASMSALARREHGRCIMCSETNPRGLQLRFTALANGSVETVFPCDRIFQGYDGILHGGIVSSLLDSAMTNCLFARGIVAHTGELTLRFLHAVTVERQAVVKAWVTRSRSPLHVVEAELLQGGEVKVRAVAKFMERCR